MIVLFIPYNLSTPTGQNGHLPTIDNSPKNSLFPLGKVVATPGAIEALDPHPGVRDEMLSRHIVGDWGEVCEADAYENDMSVEHGFRILSAYRTPAGERIWIITEADRSSTTLLLPEEY
jgi:hypothetical protein